MIRWRLVNTVWQHWQRMDRFVRNPIVRTSRVQTSAALRRILLLASAFALHFTPGRHCVIDPHPLQMHSPTAVSFRTHASLSSGVGYKKTTAAYQPACVCQGLNPDLELSYTPTECAPHGTILQLWDIIKEGNIFDIFFTIIAKNITDSC